MSAVPLPAAAPFDALPPYLARLVTPAHGEIIAWRRQLLKAEERERRAAATRSVPGDVAIEAWLKGIRPGDDLHAPAGLKMPCVKTLRNWRKAYHQPGASANLVDRRRMQIAIRDSSRFMRVLVCIFRRERGSISRAHRRAVAIAARRGWQARNYKAAQRGIGRMLAAGGPQ